MDWIGWIPGKGHTVFLPPVSRGGGPSGTEPHLEQRPVQDGGPPWVEAHLPWGLIWNGGPPGLGSAGST